MKKFSVRDLCEIGVLAALVFVSTYFLKIGPIPTPAGATMLKTGNAVCLLGGILFGKTKGGLAAGIGSMLFDLTDPVFAPSAPFTFVFFFLMAFVCGAIANQNGKAPTPKRHLLAAASGSLLYLLLTLSKSFITLLLAGSEAAAALSACGTKLLTSGVNAVFAVAVAVLLAPIFEKALFLKYKN